MKGDGASNCTYAPARFTFHNNKFKLAKWVLTTIAKKKSFAFICNDHATTIPIKLRIAEQLSSDPAART